MRRVIAAKGTDRARPGLGRRGESQRGQQRPGNHGRLRVHLGIRREGQAWGAGVGKDAGI